eukprot:TRINITY_DN25895_c0_g1_i5.p1 TRINITY_DN25895_c0_g1~~TRINITY_DN25895_c0_g1_i5.p1  ORF type:complete len:624 (+),score=119.17 TRINITY_DN25895_c0_g1_i5:111-1982(+)
MFNSRIDLTAPPDPAKLMELLASMGEDGQRFMEDKMAEMMNNLEADRATPEKRRERFRRQREQFLEMQRSMPGCSSILTSNSWDIKPAVPGSTTKALAPMFARDLQVGTTHRGRLLEGTLVEDPIFSGSAAFIMEDLVGDLVEVAVYNIPGASWEVTEKVFPKGRRITIREPYYKIRGDGSLGIRIDNPQEIQDATTQINAEDLKEQGNACFKAKDFKGALRCYEAAWEQMFVRRKELSVIFSNRAQCMLRVGETKVAARWAGVAQHLDKTNEKASYRLKEAAKQIAGNGNADWSCWRCPGVVVWTRYPAVAGSQDWVSLKDRGKDAFQASQFTDADSHYATAAARHAIVGDVAALLANMAATCLQLQEYKSAVAHSSVAVLLPAVSESIAAKCWIRRARSLEGLTDPLAACSLDGVELELVQKEAALLKDRLKTAKKVTPISSIPTDEQYKQREAPMREMKKAEGGKCSANEVAMMANMYAMAPPDAKRKMRAEFGPLIDRSPPKFHEAFPKECGWPVTDPDDVERCRHLLWDAYAHATSHPWMAEHAMRKGIWQFGDADMLKRFNGTGPLQWIVDHPESWGRPGSVLAFRDSLPAEHRYSELVRTNFCNHIPRTLEKQHEQ